jgi:molybdopterin biosynthesis enzyme
MELRRATLHMDGCQLAVRPLANQASGATTTMAATDCLVFVAPGAGCMERGTEVEVIRLSDV